MTTREQFVAGGHKKWGEMEAEWQSQGPRPHGVSSSSIDTNLGLSFGHAADVVAPDAQAFVTMPFHAFPSSNNLRQGRPLPSGMETMLIWERAGSGVRSIQILAVDLVRYSISSFPTSFQVEIVEAGRETRDIQSKIQKRRPPLARVKCAHERDNRTFGELIEQLRKVGGFAVAPYDIQDNGQRFLLAPLGNDLLCTVLPVSDIEALLRGRRSESGRTMPPVTTAQNHLRHSGWENTFAPRIDAMMAVTSPSPGINRELLGGRRSGEGAVGLSDIGRSSNFGVSGGYSEPVDRVGAHAMPTPSADFEATENFDMDIYQYVNWE